MCKMLENFEQANAKYSQEYTRPNEAQNNVENQKSDTATVQLSLKWILRPKHNSYTCEATRFNYSSKAVLLYLY